MRQIDSRGAHGCAGEGWGVRGDALVPSRVAVCCVGKERGADRAAFMATLITTAKLNDIDPQAWLADVLARIADQAIHRLDELLPWNWAAETAS